MLSPESSRLACFFGSKLLFSTHSTGGDQIGRTVSLVAASLEEPLVSEVGKQVSSGFLCGLGQHAEADISKHMSVPGTARGICGHLVFFPLTSESCLLMSTHFWKFQDFLSLARWTFWTR